MEHFESYAAMITLAVTLTQLIKSKITWFEGIKSILLMIVVVIALTGAGTLLQWGVFEGLTFVEALIQVGFAAIGLSSLFYSALKKPLNLKKSKT
jgi:hypothetical protein